MHVITRSEIADHIEKAFLEAGTADRSELIATAEQSGARPQVIAALQRLSERRYASLRQLWTELADVPVRA